MDAFEKLNYIANSLNKSFPEGNDPYQIMTRLLEESGELAEQVHIFEKSGVKEKKHGEGKPEKMAKEIQDVMVCVLSLATYYNLQDVLLDGIEQRYKRHVEAQEQ